MLKVGTTKLLKIGTTGETTREELEVNYGSLEDDRMVFERRTKGFEKEDEVIKG